MCDSKIKNQESQIRNSNSRILVVEDDGIIATRLRNMLISMGYVVLGVAASGKRAIQQAIETRPDLVLMDIDLVGELDGIETARQIQAQFELPVIYLTACSEDALLQRAKITAPYSYLAKPVQDSEIHAAIEVALYRYRLETRLKESEEIHRITLSNISDAVFITDDAGKFSFICPNVSVIFGYSFQETQEFNNISMLLGDDLFDRNELETLGEIKNIEHEVMDKAGRAHVLLVNVKRVSIQEGTVLYTCRDITERNRVEETLRRIEWLLRKDTKPGSDRMENYRQSYGNLVELNTLRVITQAIPEDVLTDIVSGYLDLLDTSAVVYERNGDYALGIFSSGWCRLLDQASHDLCGTKDNRKALASGKWHCHESCRGEASKLSIETCQPVDIECRGGIHIYAVPIKAGGNVIGFINFGYGDPPRDAKKQQEIAERFGLNVKELIKQADLYESRPPFIIELAKSRLLISAKLIGAIIETKWADDALKILNLELEKKVKQRTAKLSVELNERKRVEKSLKKSEERLRNLFETMTEGVVVINPDGQIVQANPAAEHILGLKRSEFESCNYLAPEWDLLRSDGTPLPPEEMAGLRALKEKRLVKDVVMGVKRRNGSISWINGSAAPLIEEAGKLEGVVGTFLDITKHKLAEERIKASLAEKEVLLREIHHRVKNNMQVISSLLMVQAEKIKDKQMFDIFKESQNRIKSMALIHEKFYQSENFIDVDFNGYVQNFARYLFKSYGVNTNKISLNIEFEDLSLRLDNAIPCGLIINELISNSLKYAFPQERKGEVRIALRLIDEDELELTVSDDGIGMPKALDFRNTDSLGLHLVTILAEDQLDGKIELNRTEGTEYHIWFRKSMCKVIV